MTEECDEIFDICFECTRAGTECYIDDNGEVVCCCANCWVREGIKDSLQYMWAHADVAADTLEKFRYEEGKFVPMEYMLGPDLDAEVSE